MAKFTLRADSFCFLSHNTSSRRLIFSKSSSVKHQKLHFLYSSEGCLRYRVLCSIKEKGVKETDKFDEVLSGLRVEELDSAAKVSGSGDEEVGHDWSWPPWKNIPQRYKLIGTTSLAFVICNMDKVVTFCAPSFCHFYEQILLYMKGNCFAE